MRILFQGDSVTDCGRNREQNTLGCGYPVMIAGRLGPRQPGKFEFINRGISGDRIVDIYARAKKDIWNLKPDVMSLLVGVNDVWHEILEKNGVEADRFERIYRMLLQDTQERLPNLKIILLEPYVIQGVSTVKDGVWEQFHENVCERAQSVRRLADEFKLPLIPLQSIFDEACTQAPGEYWLQDGVHPTENGHGLIAEAWLKTFRQNWEHPEAE